MIGFINGEVIFSDGVDTIVKTASGIGYQVFLSRVLAEGSQANLFISHIVKENSESLFGFTNLRSKKLFEMLLSVKGVGPKGAYAVISHLDTDQIINAVLFDTKKVLTSVPGVGAKAASQIVLDLSGKIQKIKMYNNGVLNSPTKVIISQSQDQGTLPIEQAALGEENLSSNSNELLSDTILACKELGFSEEKIVPIAQKILNAHEVSKPEQLVHLVLKEV